MRFGEPCGPQPSPRGGPLFAFAHSRGLRRLRPEICAENLKKSPENTENNKKSIQFVVRYNYLYYFWDSDPSKDVNRVAVTEKVEF